MLPPEILSPSPRGAGLLSLTGATAAEPDTTEPGSTLFGDMVAAEPAVPQPPAARRGAAATPLSHPAIAAEPVGEAIPLLSAVAEASEDAAEPEVLPEAVALDPAAITEPARERKPRLTPDPLSDGPVSGAAVPQPVLAVPEPAAETLRAQSIAPARDSEPAAFAAKEKRPAPPGGALAASPRETGPADTTLRPVETKAPGMPLPEAIVRSGPAEVAPVAEPARQASGEPPPPAGPQARTEIQPSSASAPPKAALPAISEAGPRQEPVRSREGDGPITPPTGIVALKAARTGAAAAATAALFEMAARPVGAGSETPPVFTAAPEEWRLAAAEAREIAAPRAAVPNVPPAVVAQQLSVAIGRASSDRIEIRLDPPELGRVQIDLRMEEGRLHAAIIVERPEVHDLMRRHADTLMRELEAAGHGRVSLDFSTGTGERSGRDEAPPRFAGSVYDPAAPVTAPVPEPGRRLAAGLDIRL